MRQIYITLLRTVTVSFLLAVTIEVTLQGHLMAWPNYQR